MALFEKAIVLSDEEAIEKLKYYNEKDPDFPFEYRQDAGLIQYEPVNQDGNGDREEST